MGVGVSVSKYVADCQRIFEEHGLSYEMHAWGTNVEGPWDDVFAAIKACHERAHDKGAPRISSTIKVGTRTDRDQRMREKVTSVEKKLNDPED
jgi:uncharacterized protein (TIGR00106 family)